MQRTVLEVVALIITVAFFAVLLLSVTLSGAGPLGYILVIIIFMIIVSVAGIRIAAYE
jgi:ABC-type multidrug transport system permease subunit